MLSFLRNTCRDTPAGRAKSVLNQMGQAQILTTTANEALSSQAWNPGPLRQITGDRPLLAAAECAIASYQEPESFRVTMLVAGFHQAEIIMAGPAQAGIAWTNKGILVAVRGSSERRDWRDDFASVFKTSWPGVLPKGARIGRGFKRQAVGLLKELVPRIDAILLGMPRGFTPRIIFTGHSLGAAVVPLLAAGIRATGNLPAVPQRAFLFESPRVGNRKWAEFYGCKVHKQLCPTWSIVNVHRGVVDLVTRVPKRRWGFRHIGGRIIIDNGRLINGRNSWGKYRDASGRVGHLAAWRIVSRLVAGVKAHGGEQLLQALRELENGNE